MKNFVIIGAGGYIAPRHMKAIKETGNNLLAAIDKNDSVGILDTYFPNADFFTEFERFDRHLEKLKRQGTNIDYVVVCTPNYLHDAHIRFGLRIGADVICEKPVVLNPWNVNGLLEMEKEMGKKVYSILQLRLHPAILELKDKIVNGPKDKKYEVKLKYITSRGNWYQHSWKGDVQKSGGIGTNIGIHFFDMLQWIFGGVKQNMVTQLSTTSATGKLELDNAFVDWFLSIDENTLPIDIKKVGKRAYRMLQIDNEEIEFSDGLADLHTKSYEEILNNNGFSLTETINSIEIVHGIRNANI